MLPNEFADGMTMSYDHSDFPRFFPGDPSRAISDTGGEALVERSGADNGSWSRSALRKTGRGHLVLPGFISEIAVGFGIAKAISEAQRARFDA
jgi:hypothetical protein